MDKIKEFESHLDKFLELKSRKQCLLELHSFALEQLCLYRGRNKNKQRFELSELPSKGEKAFEDAIQFYIEEQYYGYCQCLRECLEDTEKEWIEIGLKNGFIEADNDKMP